MKLDIKKWNEQRKELEAKIKELKHLIRKTNRPYKIWGNTGKVHEDGYRKGQAVYGWIDSQTFGKYGTNEDYYSLHSMKDSATLLYAVRAASRGKQHCAEWTAEEAKDKLLPMYAIEEEVPTPAQV